MPRVLSLDKSLTVLEAIFHHRDGVGTRSLAGQLNLNVATVHNIAQTFCKRGYLRQDPDTKAFHPGIRLLLLGRHPSYIRSLSLSAASIVDEVARTLNESVLLASMDHGRILNLKYVPSRQPLRAQESEDMSEHAYSTAVGKILLVSMTPLELDSYMRDTHFQKFTSHTFADEAALKEELERVKQTGYARTHDEFCEGLSAVAVPILDPWGTIVASIGASAPTIRLEKEDHFQSTLTALRAAAHSIEKQWKESHSEPPRRRVSHKIKSADPATEASPKSVDEKSDAQP